jgi:hypothetical protein
MQLAAMMGPTDRSGTMQLVSIPNSSSPVQPSLSKVANRLEHLFTRDLGRSPRRRAIDNPDLQTSLTGRRTASISTFQSRYAISSGQPGFSPADSRTAFGITTLPA